MTGRRFPDVQAAVRALLLDLAEADSIKPAAWAGHLPFLHVYRYGGTDDGRTDVASVAVHVFAADYRDQPLTEDVRERMLAGPHVVQLADDRVVVLDNVTTLEAPVLVPYGPKVVRWVSSYRVTARRSSVPPPAP